MSSRGFRREVQTASTALVPQRKVGIPIPNARLLLGFQGTKTARREGISSPFSDAAGGCTSPQNSGPPTPQKFTHAGNARPRSPTPARDRRFSIAEFGAALKTRGKNTFSPALLGQAAQTREWGTSGNIITGSRPDVETEHNIEVTAPRRLLLHFVGSSKRARKIVIQFY